MDFNWNRYLDVSKKVKNNITTTDEEIAEAFFRTATSRAYYAIYHLARELAKEKFNYDDERDKIEGQGSHRRLQTYLLETGDADYEKLSKLLSRMHRYRKDCDYEKFIEKPKALMDYNINLADDALLIINSK